MSFSMNLGEWNSIFAVPSSVVDKHIKLAGSAQLKILLWILRNAGKDFSIEDISSALSMHPVDVKDAMQYWIETNILSSTDKVLLPGQANKPNEEKRPLVTDEPEIIPFQSKDKPRLLSRPQKPDNAFVAKRIGECSEIAFLVQEAEIIIGRPLSNPDCATLLMLYDNDGLPIDVIIMILQYCFSIGKSNMRYIEKVAVNWAHEEIDTLEKAEKKIRNLTEHREAWSIVQRTIGIDKRSPTEKEQEAATRWVNEWGYSPEMIREAYERCIDAKGKYLLSYIDSIIKRWHRDNIKTLSQAKEEKSRVKVQKFGSESYKPSYDISEYERSSIFDEI